eukprot:scaffold115447_cov13-Tisochrysis_lutea.AAC.1
MVAPANLQPPVPRQQQLQGKPGALREQKRMREPLERQELQQAGVVGKRPHLQVSLETSLLLL